MREKVERFARRLCHKGVHLRTNTIIRCRRPYGRCRSPRRHRRLDLRPAGVGVCPRGERLQTAPAPASAPLPQVLTLVEHPAKSFCGWSERADAAGPVMPRPPAETVVSGLLWEIPGAGAGG